MDEMDAFNSRTCDRIYAFISYCQSGWQKTDPSNKPIYVHLSATESYLSTNCVNLEKMCNG